MLEALENLFASGMRVDVKGKPMRSAGHQGPNRWGKAQSGKMNELIISRPKEILRHVVDTR